MDFALSEELKMVQATVRRFVAEQLKPLEREILGRAFDLSDAQLFLPPEKEEELIKMVKEMGLWGVGIPEELGGVDLGTLGNCIVEEELAQTVVPFSFGSVTPLLFECNEEQRQRYFLPVFNRQKRAYLALMEPEKEADLTSMRVRAEKRDGHYVLSGRKACLSEPGEDYFAVVFAVTEPGRGPREGVTCFLVDKDTPGFSLIGGEEKTGWEARLRRPFFLDFDNCRVAKENVLGEEGKAFHLGKRWLPLRRIVRSARCVGVAQRMLEEATLQAQSWESFGQTISKRPSVQAALADMAVAIRAGRLVVYEAAWKADQGNPIKTEAAMAKIFATQMLNSVADNAVHVWGGPPYVAGLPMERFCRSCLAMSAAEASLQLQRNIVARDILRGLWV